MSELNFLYDPLTPEEMTCTRALGQHIGATIFAYIGERRDITYPMVLLALKSNFDIFLTMVTEKTRADRPPLRPEDTTDAYAEDTAQGDSHAEHP